MGQPTTQPPAGEPHHHCHHQHHPPPLTTPRGQDNYSTAPWDAAAAAAAGASGRINNEPQFWVVLKQLQNSGGILYTGKQPRFSTRGTCPCFMRPPRRYVYQQSGQARTLTANQRWSVASPTDISEVWSTAARVGSSSAAEPAITTATTTPPPPKPGTANPNSSIMNRTSYTASWLHPGGPNKGLGRTSVWVHHTCSVAYVVAECSSMLPVVALCQ